MNSVGKYKGNDTLYENKALLAPKVATTTPDYNATMAMFNTPPTTGNTTKGKAAAGTPSMPLGNFSIPGESGRATVSVLLSSWQLGTV